ncbi:GAF domain-containing protein [Arthrobacter ruber]|uniref:GAF domain-containing protein n=1 Tax=Arthrobacter ruber TaxID=1258893 RepID=UPI0012FFD55E|nr:GAF domain-containing protein [Arthrobacter ruber]
MISPNVQQWTAVQSLRSARLEVTSVWFTYASFGGQRDLPEVVAYLQGAEQLPIVDRDLVAHALNEMIDEFRLLAEGAHYSSQQIADRSPYRDALRVLVLDPDGYRFDRPAVTAPRGISCDGLDAGDADERAAEAEDRRCRALHATGLLDTGAEARFDRITRRTREHFGVSSASIALVAEDRQVIKSVAGPVGQDLPRASALCARTIEAPRTLVIMDARTDPEFRHHPLVVDGPHIRFYAGHPITTADGWRIGTLCLIDEQPRYFSEDDARDLRRMTLDVQIEIWLRSTP